MNNQMILRTMYDRTIKMNELYHHGVEGMSWGDRNGPPYPLSGANKKEARREAKAKIEKEKRLEKMRKAAAKKRKEQVKQAKKQEKIDKMKLKLLRKGDMNKINKKSEYFTNEELQFARERNREMIETRYAKNPNKAPDPHAMEKLMNVVSRVGQIAQAAVPVVTLLKGAKELKNMGIDRELKIEKAMNEATESKIRLVKDFDPEAAARLAGDYTGTKVEHKPKKEEKKPGDIKTISEALMKVNPQAAAEYLKEQTGYGGTVTTESLANNPSYEGTKKVKGRLESILGKSKKIKPAGTSKSPSESSKSYASTPLEEAFNTRSESEGKELLKMFEREMRNTPYRLVGRVKPSGMTTTKGSTFERITPNDYVSENYASTGKIPKMKKTKTSTYTSIGPQFTEVMNTLKKHIE